jgi:hypothetical protein
MKKRTTKLTREFWERHAETQRMMADRIAYHERKLAEEKAERERQT